jgi:hypothetical protein
MFALNTLNLAEFVNQTMTTKELEGLRLSVQRGQPHGNERWQTSIAKHLGLESTLRACGRARKRCVKLDLSRVVIGMHYVRGGAEGAEERVLYQEEVVLRGEAGF